MTSAPTCPRVLFISADPVGRQMAGLGIRYTELAGVVSQHAEVTVAHGGTSSEPLPSGVPTVPYAPHDSRALKPLIAAADVVVTHPQWPVVTSWLRRSRARVVFDLYDPETLETLELFAGRRMTTRRVMDALTVDRLHDALRTGHHFMCASETQRDLWLGAMLALRLLQPPVYDRDPTLRDLIDVVPFGVPDDPPSAASHLLAGPRETLRGLGPDTEIVLWNGGIWRWLDAPTAIRAIKLVAERRPGARLVFMGGSGQEAARVAAEHARSLAAELGLLDRVVHFNAGWIPYEERAGWLMQADCALTAHPDHTETHFAFRTRVLDCLWAGVPVVTTSGDDLAERVEREGLGATAPPHDAGALALSVERVLARGRASYAESLTMAAATFKWSRVSEPLVSWIRTAGSRAPTAAAPTAGHRLRAASYRLGGRALLARRNG